MPDLKQLSLGRQEFAKVINGNCIYVDKTQHVYQLLNTGNAYFISRPRRFGKSLLVNTLKELFSGSKELFRGLWIENKIDWKVRPVIQIDFSRMDYKDVDLRSAINSYLGKTAEQFEIILNENTNKNRFLELIRLLYEKHGPVVILIDEYDKPIIDYLENFDQAEANRDILKNFYSCLKGLDNYIHFLFITGVSKFSKVSIFSDLNHLEDLTVGTNFAKLFGYTLEEINIYFDDYLQALEKEFSISRTELIAQMQKKYNGYSWDGKNSVYNPFSLQRFLKEQSFKNYWFATGTTTFLVNRLKKMQKPPEELNEILVTEAFFDRFELRSLDIVSLLFQTGYLTIKHYDRSMETYLLGFPNEEVENSFLNNLLEVYCNKVQSELSPIIINLRSSIMNPNPEELVNSFKRLYAGIPYDDFISESAVEGIFRSNAYLALKILGVYVQAEVHTNKGRIDALIQHKDNVFVIEFKIGTAKSAMRQIKTKNYAESYTDKNVYLIALGFDKKSKNITTSTIEKPKPAS
ncbi:MAG: AAA family ATPase [Candidatus Riflebacteria bacterium]|nr:AAA family ATPase [Candidatus Riflebacteria bacterium]